MRPHRPPTLRATLLLALTCTHAFAAPTGGVIITGSGSIAHSGATTTVSQASNHLSLNWATFNVGAPETVRFNQPSASAIAVNRIADVNGSTLLGKLQANGQVFLINPHGLIFGAGSQVNVGGLVASTLDLADADLASASRAFAATGSNTAGVVNHGTLTAANGGYLALLGSSVTNTGTLTAPGGTVALGAGNRVTLDFAGDKLVKLAVDANTVATLAANGGLIRADGGAVYLSAGARDSLVASVVNNTGVIEARTVDTSKGTIILLGGMADGTTTVAGTLDASAPHGGDGGFIETSAAHVKIADGAKITTAASAGKTGTWLIDPTDFTIAAGSGALTTSGIGATTLSSSLGTSDVTLVTSAAGGDLGDIFVNAPVSWSANTLTLSAHRNIEINANLTGTGSAKLALLYGQGAVAASNTADYTLATGKTIRLPAGDNFFTQLGSDGDFNTYTVITDLGTPGSTSTTDLQGMLGDVTKNYALGANIDASATSTWNSNAGFDPVGTNAVRFTGTFTGLGHSITGLTINRPTTDDVGLFGYTNGATLRDVGLVGVSVSGQFEVGGLVAVSIFSRISNASITGSVSGTSYVGGLIGNSAFCSIRDVSSTGSVSGVVEILGGLIGQDEHGTISNAFSTSAVSGLDTVGGLLGVAFDSRITNGYSTGVVSGRDYVGGLVGGCYDGIFSNVHSTGGVSGGDRVGGLIGNSAGGSFSNAYSTGAISGTNWVGGLFGLVGDSTVIGGSFTISDVYSTGTVSGVSRVGGLIGEATGGSITQAYSTGAISGTGAAVGGLIGIVSTSTISQVYRTGNVSGLEDVGGLVGANFTGSISQAYSTGDVSGGDRVGGLIGFNSSGSISQAYSTGTVTGVNFAGGLIGNAGTSTISNVYSTGAVSGTFAVGGLIGFSDTNTISNVYSIGAVSGTSSVGGLIGFFSGGSASNAYWNTETSGQASSAVGTGITTADRLNPASYAGFNFSSVWNAPSADSNQGYPTLQALPVIVFTATVGKVYGQTLAGSLAAADFSFTGTLLSGDSLSGLTFTSSGTGATANVGSYGLSFVSPTGTLADLSVYNFSFSGGSALTVAARTLTVTAVDQTKVYGNANPTLSHTVAAATANSGLVNGDTAFTGSVVTTASPTSNVGNYAITQAGLNYGSNYTVSFTAGTLAVTARALTVTAADQTKVYGNANPELTHTVAAATANSGLVNGDTATGALATVANPTSNVGNYGITQGNLSYGDNYTVDFTGGSLAVTARALTVTAADQTKVYGNANPTLTHTVAAATANTGLVNGDTAFTGALATAANLTSNVGNYAITQGNLSYGDNYTVGFTAGSLAVSTRALTVAAAAQTKVARTANPELTFSVTTGNVVNGDLFSGELATVVDAITAAGSYAITAGSLTLGSNYVLTVTPGNFTVTAVPVTVTLAPQEIHMINTPLIPVSFGKNTKQVDAWEQVDAKSDSGTEAVKANKDGTQSSADDEDSGLKLRFKALAVPTAAL